MCLHLSVLFIFYVSVLVRASYDTGSLILSVYLSVTTRYRIMPR